MSYVKTALKRSTVEKVFLVFFVPAVILGYAIYKYPGFFVSLGWFESLRSLYFFGKHPSFWYSLLYTAIVCGIAGKVILQNKSPYKKGKNSELSSYQRWKFISIFVSQLFFFFILPYIIPPLMAGRDFFADSTTPLNKDAYIYVSRGFTSWGGFFYIFILVPAVAWFMGKRYCAWFCACGNLAETIGITKWGASWVKHKTPTGKTAKRLEHLQTAFLFGGIVYGLILFFDLLKVFSAPTLVEAGRYYQDFIVDFIFGAVIGIAAYPFYGTRVWCRYGCPLAKGMELFGKYTKSRFKVAANDKCKGLNLCSQVCPMGIDVASYAHQDKKPIMGSFGLEETPCIGCGGCVDICPVDALSFEPVFRPSEQQNT
jgi:polyferredoxin